MALSFDLKAMRKLQVTRLHHWTSLYLHMQRVHMHSTHEAPNLQNASAVIKNTTVSSCTVKPYLDVRWVNRAELEATEPVSFIVKPPTTSSFESPSFTANCVSIASSSTLASPPVIIKTENNSKVANREYRQESIRYLPSADVVHVIVVRSLEVHPDNVARAVQLLVGARTLSVIPHIESFDVIVKALCSHCTHKEIGEKLVCFVESMMLTISSAKVTENNYDFTKRSNTFAEKEFWESSFAMLQRIITHHLLHYAYRKEEEEIVASSEEVLLLSSEFEFSASSITEWEQLLSFFKAIEEHHMELFENELDDEENSKSNIHFISLWKNVFDALWEFVKHCRTVEQSIECKKDYSISNDKGIGAKINIIARTLNVICNTLKSFCTASDMYKCGREVIVDSTETNVDSENSEIVKEKTQDKQSRQMESLQRRLTIVFTILERKFLHLQQQLSETCNNTKSAHKCNSSLQSFVQSFCSNTLTLICELISTAIENVHKVEHILLDVHLSTIVQIFESSSTLLQQVEQTAKQISTLVNENLCDDISHNTIHEVIVANGNYSNANSKCNYYYDDEIKRAWLFVISKWQEVLLTLQFKRISLKYVTDDKHGKNSTSICSSTEITKDNESTVAALASNTKDDDNKTETVNALCNRTWLNVIQVSDVLLDRLTVHYSEFVKAMELWEYLRHLYYNSVFLHYKVNEPTDNSNSSDSNIEWKTVESAFHKAQMRFIIQMHDLQMRTPNSRAKLSCSTALSINQYHRMTNGREWQQQLITRITTSIAQRDITEGCRCIEEWADAIKEYHQNKNELHHTCNSSKKMHVAYEQIQTTFPQNEVKTNSMICFNECNHDLLCHSVLLMLECIIDELPWLTSWLYYRKVICSLSCLCSMKYVSGFDKEEIEYVNGTRVNIDNMGNNKSNINYECMKTNEQMELQLDLIDDFRRESNSLLTSKCKSAFFIDDKVEQSLNDALIVILTKMRLESSTSLIDAIHVLECTVKFTDGNWHVHSAVYDELLHILYNFTNSNHSTTNNGNTNYDANVYTTNNRGNVATLFTRAHEEVCLSMVHRIIELLHEQSIKNKITNIENEYAKIELKDNEEDTAFMLEVPLTQSNLQKEQSTCTQVRFSRLCNNHNNSSNRNSNSTKSILSATKTVKEFIIVQESELPTLNNEEVNLLATLAPLIAIATPAQLEMYKSQYFSCTRVEQPQSDNSSRQHEQNNLWIKRAEEKSLCRIRAVDLRPLLVKYRKPILWRIHSQTMSTPDYNKEFDYNVDDTSLMKATTTKAATRWNSQSDYTLINSIAQDEKVQLYLSTLLHQLHITSIDDIFDDAHAETIRQIARTLQTTLFNRFVTEETAMEIVRRAATAALNLQQIRWPMLLEAELAYYTLHHKGRTPLQLQLSSIASSQPGIAHNRYQRESPVTSKDIACYYSVFHNVLLPSLQLTLTQLRMLARYVERVCELKQIHDERLSTLHKSVSDASTRRVMEMEENNNYERTMYELCSYIYFDQCYRNDLALHERGIASPLIIYIVYNRTYKTLRKLHSQQKTEQEEELILEGCNRWCANKDNSLLSKLRECVNRYKTNNYTSNDTLSQLTKKIISLYVKARRLEDSRHATCMENTLPEGKLKTTATVTAKARNVKKPFLDIVCTACTKLHDQEYEQQSEEHNYISQKQEQSSVAKYSKSLLDVMFSSKSKMKEHELNVYSNFTKQNDIYSLEMRWLLDSILYHINKNCALPDSISLMLCEDCKQIMSQSTNSVISHETCTSKNENSISGFSAVMSPEFIKNEVLQSCNQRGHNACQSIMMQDIKYAHAVRVHDMTLLLTTLSEVNAFRYLNPIHCRTLQTLLAVQPAQLARIPHRKERKNISSK